MPPKGLLQVCLTSHGRAWWRVSGKVLKWLHVETPSLVLSAAPPATGAGSGSLPLVYLNKENLSTTGTTALTSTQHLQVRNWELVSSTAWCKLVTKEVRPDIGPLVKVLLAHCAALFFPHWCPWVRCLYVSSLWGWGRLGCVMKCLPHMLMQTGLDTCGLCSLAAVSPIQVELVKTMYQGKWFRHLMAGKRQRMGRALSLLFGEA